MVNQNFLRLGENYLFSQVAQQVRAYQTKHPHKTLVKLSIGDVSQPLPAVVVQALQQASADLAQATTFHGYGPETGYPWLKDAIANYYQQEKQVVLRPDEIIIGDGAKSDVANLLDIFAPDCRVVMVDPVYPVYLESNLIQGRQPQFLAATASNHFLPMPTADLVADIIYLCNPANPTGACYTRAQLKQWVAFARRQHAVILYDAAYESYIQDPTLPTSIYQIPGAKSCAIEIGSLSKLAGFTGLRCSYTLVPRVLRRDGVSLNRLWTRRQTVKFNGASYLTQRGAAAVFTPAGLTAVRANIADYLQNARQIAAALDASQLTYVGGQNSPYLWVRCPDGLTAWQFFALLLNEVGIVCTPGIGFGQHGANYVRLTGFNTAAQTAIACQRLRQLGQLIDKALIKRYAKYTNEKDCYQRKC